MHLFIIMKIYIHIMVEILAKIANNQTNARGLLITKKGSNWKIDNVGRVFLPTSRLFTKDFFMSVSFLCSSLVQM